MSRSNQVNFEKCAGYFDKYKVPPRIKSLLPNAKIVMMLRNPIDRAYSWYLHEISKMDKVTVSFSEIIRMNATNEWADFKSKILIPGFYFKHIRRWLETFSLQSVHFVDADDFINDPVVNLHKFMS